MLSFDVFGETGAPGLLIAHGLYGSARNWRSIAKRLSKSHRVVAVDMRNHGASPFLPEMTYFAMASDLAEVIDATEIGPATVLGHSMGGKAVMSLALLHSEHVDRLIVADIAPVKYDHGHAHIIDAMEAVPLDRIRRRSEARDGLIAELDDPTLAAFLLQQLDADETGFRWSLNLPVLRANLPGLLDFPKFDATSSHSALFLSGAASDYVTDEGREAARALFPNARFAALKGAGHWLHAEAPDAFVATVEAYLGAS